MSRSSATLRRWLWQILSLKNGHGTIFHALSSLILWPCHSFYQEVGSVSLCDSGQIDCFSPHSVLEGVLGDWGWRASAWLPWDSRSGGNKGKKSDCLRSLCWKGHIVAPRRTAPAGLLPTGSSDCQPCEWPLRTSSQAEPQCLCNCLRDPKQGLPSWVFQISDSRNCEQNRMDVLK